MKYLSYKKFVLPLIGGLTLVPVFASATPATAIADNSANVKGKIDINLTITPGCIVQPISSSSSDQQHLADDSEWTSLNFNNMDLGTDHASNDIDIQCTASATPSLKLDGGKYGSGDNRYMEDSKGDKQSYTLAAGPNGDEGNIAPNQPVSPPANGDYEIYATTNILPKTAVGAYKDTIEATLSW
ncbi:Spore coat protein U (SCPU) domain-containing protein [Izhakiella capsodis]|uniref:Spore coat protein U (SCPU) domain-containing protein n=1 Tax=Izhakiella capsodis TaxID=1367852 RepID=A0A1I4V7E1_9GAMM|nr:spore coat protein U domain-containing protein [Izhakiella capsodis]SFM97107.1 Spore coat protein U (SCPU) domain-containing protein [Izhakiella capsodis]